MNLPSWLDPVFTSDEMRATDSWAIDTKGTPSIELMERAGSEVARAVTELYPSDGICVVCGKGNNGGDGLVCARLLAEQGHTVRAVLLAPAEQISGDAKENLDRLHSTNCELVIVDDEKGVQEALTGAQVVVDAVFGTGFNGKPRGLPAAAIKAINEHGAHTVAVDMPSGVDGSTGETAGVATNASSTVTFHKGKVGQFINPGKACTGKVEVVDIGIPPSGEGDAPPTEPAAGLISSSVIDLYPKRARNSTKFSVGAVAVIGGSSGLTGAVCMASEAAMRSGAGYVQAVVPHSLNSIFEEKLTEVMTVPADDKEGAFTSDALEGALEACARSDAVILGPGMGRSDGSLELARRLVQEVDGPLIVDADGLYALIGYLELLGSREHRTVLTPHAGELARLMEVGSDEVGEGRLRFAQDLAEKTSAVVVLKGDDSIVAHRDGRVAISRGATPGLASAGSGDVLSGVIGALLAKQIDAFEAASLGVYMHAEAGIAAAKKIGESGMIATDVIEMLPKQIQ